MGEPKFTKGPWTFTADYSGDDPGDTLDGFRLVAMPEGAAPITLLGGCGCCGSPWLNGPDARANAHLITSAPVLFKNASANLATLENLLAYLRKHEASLPPISLATLETRIAATRATMALALGEAQP